MFRSKRSVVWIGILLMAIVLAVTACGGQDQLAVYKLEPNDTDTVQVTEEEFETFKSVKEANDPYYEQRKSMDTKFEEDMLKQYIALKIFESRLSEEERDKLKQEANDAFTSMTKELETTNPDWESQWNEMLDQVDLTEDEYKEYMLLQSMAIDQIAASVSEADLKAHYEETIAADPNAYVSEVTVSHILIGTNEDRTQDEALELAESVKQKLDNGEDFAALAASYSDDPGSKDQGGTMKNANVNNFVAPFRKAVLELPLNKISDPVETTYGYHLIKVEEREVPTYEDVIETVKGQMVEQRFVAFMEQELPDHIVEMDLPA
ncbi:peptidylprolyl isomerase [Marinicrinis sediminis]|uniref:Peptidylprolyl isomerase n=1 Tax=Marinicrinis sediminis TaxID=1652465 RepID=A0ABW5R980_9BACL